MFAVYLQNIIKEKTQKWSLTRCALLYHGLPSIGSTASSSSPTAFLLAASLPMPMLMRVVAV